MKEDRSRSPPYIRRYYRKVFLFEPYSSSKHSGVLSYFNRHFIKGGKISKDIGRAVNKAFDIRQRGDYREQILLTQNQVEPFISWADELIDSVKDFLRDRGHI